MQRSAGPEGAFLFDLLEARMLLSSYIYEEFSHLVGPVAPRVFADGQRGPAVFIGDIDHDGVPDLLVGNAGVVTSGPTPVDSSGATVYSGASGQVIRTHTRPEARFGWYVAAVGDVDNDGTSDYAIGSGLDTGSSKAFVFSGATGHVLLSFTGNAQTGGATVAGTGDLNHDGHADVLVGYPGENRVVVYSGADGLVLHQYLGDTSQQITLLGLGVAGGTDFNGDGTKDFLVAGHQGTHAGNETDPFHVPIYVYSGADGTLLRTIDSFQNIPDGAAVPALEFDLVGRFTNSNGDIVRAIVYGSGNFVYVFDPITGERIAYLHPTEDGSIQSAVTIGDINADGTDDIAVGLPNGSRGTGAPLTDHGSVDVYSGANGARLNILKDPRFSASGVRMGISLAYGADLDADGLPDLIAVGDQNADGQGSGPGRVYAFSGLTLIPPIPDHFTADASGNLVAWGAIRDHGFLIRNNMLTLVSSLSGFAATDRVIAYAATAGGGGEVLGASDAAGHNPFVWRSGSSFNNGTRTSIAGFTEVGGPAGTYTALSGTDINGAGITVVQRVRNSSTATAWLYNPTANTMTFLFDGSGIAVNASGNVLGVGTDSTTAMLWTPTALTPISGFSPSDLNDNNVIVGRAQRTGDTASRPYTWNNGTFAALPLITGGQDFVPFAINNSGVVVGSYRITATFAISMFIYTPAGMSTTDAKTLTDVDAPAAFTNAQSFFLYGVNNSGVILASIPLTGGALMLIPYSDTGPYTVGGSAVIDSTALPNGGIFVTTTNAAGEIVVYFRSPLSDPWHYLDIAHASGAPRLTGNVVAWYDPQERLTYVAAASTSGLLLISQATAGNWTIRNLTNEVAGSVAIVGSLVVVQPQSGMTILGGMTAAGDLVIYGQTAQTNSQGRVVWGYDNLFDSVVRAFNIPVPDFNIAERGHLVAYVTPWDGLNIVGSAANGQPVALWNAPGIVGWRVSNLSDATTNPLGHSGLTHLTAYITSWGGINLASGDNVNVLWWAPGLGGEWRTDSIRAIASGPELRADTLSAYVTPWGGLNIAGLDDLDRLWVYWWTPDSNQWAAAPISASLPAGSPTPVGNVSGLVTPAGDLSIFARTQAGDLLHYFWQVSNPVWTVADATLVGTT